MGYIIDSCIWIDIERGTLSPSDIHLITKKEPVYITPISIAELVYGAYATTSTDLRTKRLAALKRLTKKPMLPIDGETGEIFGRLSVELSKNKRGNNFRIQDVWLASLAIQHNFKLLTHNKKDFIDIPGLDLVIYKETLT